MSQGTFIYELFRRINKSERTRFYDDSYKRKRKGYANYVELFDLIINQNCWDDESVLANLQNESIAKNLHVYKRRLYLNFLHSMNPAPGTAEGKLFQNIEIIKYLFRKSLYHQTQRFFVIALESAQKLEDFSVVIQLYELSNEGRRMSRNNEIDLGATFLDEIQQILGKLNQYLSLLLTRIGIDNHLPQFTELDREGFYDKFDKSNILSRKAEIEWKNILVRLYKKEGDYEAVIRVNLELVECYENIPEEILPADLRGRHLFTLTNLGIHAVYLEKQQLMETILAKLSDWGANEDENFRARLAIVLIRINWFRKSEEFSELKTAYLEFFEQSDRALLLQPRMACKILFTASVGFVLGKDYKSAIKALLLFISDNPEVATDLVFYSKIVFALTQIGIGNLPQVRKEAKNIAKYARKHGLEDPGLQIILDFLKRVSREGLTDQNLDTFSENWGVLTKGKVRSDLIHAFPWDIWINSMRSSPTEAPQ